MDEVTKFTVNHLLDVEKNPSEIINEFKPEMTHREWEDHVRNRFREMKICDPDGYIFFETLAKPFLKLEMGKSAAKSEEEEK